jgi:hypothetical protein
MTKVTVLIFSNEKMSVEKIRDKVVSALRSELSNQNIRVGSINHSSSHDDYSCYVNIDIQDFDPKSPVQPNLYSQ